MPLTPNNRNEAWMKGMVDGSTTLEPNNRREHWYKEIVDAIGSGGGGGGGGAASINVTDVPYLAQALQTAVTTAVTTGVTSHANQPFYYQSDARDENVAANIETLISFLTDNEGNALYLVSDSVYMPLTYKASTGYVSFKMKGTGTGYAYDLDVEIVRMTQFGTSEIVGATFSIYGFATTNV